MHKINTWYTYMTNFKSISGFRKWSEKGADLFYFVKKRLVKYAQNKHYVPLNGLLKTNLGFAEMNG